MVERCFEFANDIGLLNRSLSRRNIDEVLEKFKELKVQELSAMRVRIIGIEKSFDTSTHSPLVLTFLDTAISLSYDEIAKLIEALMSKQSIIETNVIKQRNQEINPVLYSGGKLV